MNKEIKQILENQLLIMESLKLTERDAWKTTLKLVYPTEQKEDCCEMEKTEKGCGKQLGKDQVCECLCVKSENKSGEKKQ